MAFLFIHRFSSLRVFLLHLGAGILFAGLAAQTRAQTPEKAVQALTPAPAADAKATGEWLVSLFTLQDGKILVAGKASGDFQKARLPFPKPVEIQHNGETMIVNQAGLYPVEIGPTEHQKVRFSIYTPMYDFLDDTIAADGLPDYVPHLKNDAMTGEGFRTIATLVHAHFTRLTGSLPEHYRTLDDISYPSESYVWQTPDVLIILAASNGNDTDGIHLMVTSDKSALGKNQKRQSTTEDIFAGWGDPLPHLNSAKK